jgi:hypothetical protein
MPTPASLQLLYTGASSFLAEQSDSSRSLGGAISSSPIGNDVLRNVFGDISQLTKITNRPEFRAIAINNVGGTAATAVKLIINPSDQDSDSRDDDSSAVCTYLVGYAVPTQDSCGDYSSELLPSMYSKPFTVTMVSASSQINLPDIAAGGYLIIYLQRTLISSFLEPLTTQQYVDILEGTTIMDTREDILLTISWT